MHSKLTKFLCLQLQFIPDLSRFSSTNRQQTELLKKSNAASISGSFRHVVFGYPCDLLSGAFKVRMVQSLYHVILGDDDEHFAVLLLLFAYGVIGGSCRQVSQLAARLGLPQSLQFSVMSGWAGGYGSRDMLCASCPSSSQSHNHHVSVC